MIRCELSGGKGTENFDCSCKMFDVCFCGANSRFKAADGDDTDAVRTAVGILADGCQYHLE